MFGPSFDGDVWPRPGDRAYSIAEFDISVMTRDPEAEMVGVIVRASGGRLVFVYLRGGATEEVGRTQYMYVEDFDRAAHFPDFASAMCKLIDGAETVAGRAKDYVDKLARYLMEYQTNAAASRGSDAKTGG